MTTGQQARRAMVDGPRPDRAVIDIGSNTVRMVVYSGSPRAPDTWLNEKVTAKLGRELATTGRMPEKAIDIAMSGLARFAVIIEDLDISNVQTVATAAVRDSANGAEFLDAVRGLGLSPRLLSGEEEARISALGVIGAISGAQGVVADLGGGSLELVVIGNGACHAGVSLPLGTLRLPALHAEGEAPFRKAVVRELRREAWAPKQPGPLYLVGGTWRALAAFIMHKSDYPLSDPHAMVVSREEADRFAKKLMRTDPAQLSAISGISSSRAAGLPDAAAMLRVLLAELEPDGLVFSSWGLREGLLFEQLPQAAREQDPLLAAVTAFGRPRGASPAVAAMVAGWTAGITSGDGDGTERLRLAAITLSLAAARIEPNMRLGHATDWAMHKRWLALDHAGRAMITAALRASCGKAELLPELLQLASEESLRDAVGWGLAIRLCRRIGAGSRISMLTSSLERVDGRLVLWLDESRQQLATEPVIADLRNLAEWMRLAPELRIGDVAEARIA